MGNFSIPHLPIRSEKPRQKGLTMVMDKGLALRQAEDLVTAAAPYVDLLKLGWATSYLSPQLPEKLACYREAGLMPYFGGTLFELFLVRGAFDAFRKLLDTYKMQHVEVSDGSISLPHEEKCHYIETLSKQAIVLSEVGSKDETKIIPPYKWIAQMRAELKAGATYVIGEAREGGTTGLFRGSGEVRQGLVEEILTEVPYEKIIWETPQKVQQAWFIKLLGADVNLGNIPPTEALPLESMRLGLRSDTFSHFYCP